MRIAFLLLFISLLLCACAAENPAYRNYLVATNLKGRVKRTIEVISKIDSNSGKVTAVEDSIVEDYDKQGSLTHSVTYDNKGSIKREGIISYKPSMTKTIMEDSLITERSSFKRAPHGHLIQEILSIQNVYNHGKYEGDKIEWSKSVYFYNKTGNEDSVWNYKYEDTTSINDKRFYKYDNKHHLIEEKWCDDSGKIESTITYEYDQRGNKIKETWPADILTNIPSVHSFKYDDYGNETQAINNSGGRLSSPYGFDREVKYDKYDNKHNWIQYTEFNGGKPISRRIRRITYY